MSPTTRIRTCLVAVALLPGACSSPPPKPDSTPPPPISITFAPAPVPTPDPPAPHQVVAPSAADLTMLGLDPQRAAVAHVVLSTAAPLIEAADRLDQDLNGICRRIAHKMGMPGPYGSTKDLCEAVGTTILEAKGLASSGESSSIRASQCFSSMGQFAACYAKCAATIGGSAEVECHGSLWGKCDGACRGRCTSDGERCGGECNGKCDGRMEGDCTGECTECGKKGCAGRLCKGRCIGHATGKCAGACFGECRNPSRGACKGLCERDCSVAMVDGSCTGEPTGPGSPECSALCSARGLSHVWCTHPGISYSLSHIKDAAVAERVVAAKREGRAELANIILGTSPFLLSAANRAHEHFDALELELRQVPKMEEPIGLRAQVLFTLDRGREAAHRIRESVKLASKP